MKPDVGSIRRWRGTTGHRATGDASSRAVGRARGERRYTSPATGATGAGATTTRGAITATASRPSAASSAKRSGSGPRRVGAKRLGALRATDSRRTDVVIEAAHLGRTAPMTVARGPRPGPSVGEGAQRGPGRI